MRDVGSGQEEEGKGEERKAGARTRTRRKAARSGETIVGLAGADLGPLRSTIGHAEMAARALSRGEGERDIHGSTYSLPSRMFLASPSSARRGRAR